MSSVINVVKGDTHPDLVFRLTDQTTKAVVDLSDVTTVAMTIRVPGTTTVLVTLTGSVDAPPTSGYIRLVWGVGDLTTLAVGQYEGSIKLTHVAGQLLTIYKTVRINVRA